MRCAARATSDLPSGRPLAFLTDLVSMEKEKDPPVNSELYSESVKGSSRRRFLGQLAAISAGLSVAAPIGRSVAKSLGDDAKSLPEDASPASGLIDITLNVNTRTRQLRIDPRVTLLDAVRERFQLTGAKKGYDHGACGASTVHIAGKRVLSCLTLAEGTKLLFETDPQTISQKGDEK